MIILDTNVVSEFMKPEPDQVVVDWLNRQPTGSVWTTAVTIYEVEFGLQRMPEGKRRTFREELFQKMIAVDLSGRILPFDTSAALAAGALGAKLQAGGRSIDIRDLQIAGIARANGAMVATGNVKHFTGACSVRNPWEDA